MREIELLLCEILNCNRADLYLNKIFEPVNRKEFYFAQINTDERHKMSTDYFLEYLRSSAKNLRPSVNLDISSVKDRLNQWEPQKLFLLQNAIKRRINDEPLQYILGSQEFMGLEFKVSPGVFIPRPETEILVEKAISTSGVARQASHVTRILDIGTGSGNIAISLAKFLEDSEIVAVDISREAIDVAKSNALINGVADEISFINQDFFNLRPATCDLRQFSFDLIVTNPPYIPTNDIDNLAKEISFEPRIALDGGVDGLEFYRKIILKAAGYLKDDGFLLMELGFNQAEPIKDIVRLNRQFEIVEVLQDYSEIERVIILRKKIHV